MQTNPSPVPERPVCAIRVVWYGTRDIALVPYPSHAAAQTAIGGWTGSSHVMRAHIVDGSELVLVGGQWCWSAPA